MSTQAHSQRSVEELRCFADALHAELTRISSESPKAFVPRSGLKAVEQLIGEARRLRPRDPLLESIPVPDSDSETNEVMFSLAMVRAGIACAGASDRGAALEPTRIRNLIITALAGLSGGVSLPFLIDVNPAVSAGVIASGSAAVVIRETVATGRQALPAASDPRPKQGWVRRGWTAFVRALPTIATGAITSGLGSFAGDALKLAGS
jgi:hypothetical protein